MVHLVKNNNHVQRSRNIIMNKIICPCRSGNIDTPGSRILNLKSDNPVTVSVRNGYTPRVP